MAADKFQVAVTFMASTGKYLGKTMTIYKNYPDVASMRRGVGQLFDEFELVEGDLSPLPETEDE